MATNPIEVVYQTGRTIYCIRSSVYPASSIKIYNTVTGLYETYSAANWANYAITIPEIVPGYYRVVPPTNSLTLPATEIIFEVSNSLTGPQISDAPPIATGSSQGVNVGTVNGVQSSIGSVNPSSDTDICNLALTHLGQKLITSLDDATTAARRCNQIYAEYRDDVLRACNWNFATIIDTLTELTDETVTGWGYVYTLPTDSIFIRKIYPDDSSVFDLPESFNSATPVPITNPKGEEFKIVFDTNLSLPVIATNFNPAYIEYTARMVDSSLYDSQFIKALAYKLAADLATILTGAGNRKEEMLKNYAIAISDAMKSNGIEANERVRRTSSYVDAR